MNVEQQQQQHLSAAPTSLLATEMYGVGGTATSATSNSANATSSAAAVTQTTTTTTNDLMQSTGVTTTYVTISMMPPPPLMSQATPTSMSHASLSATSTFKTPLLPMPSLEDIEGSLSMVTTAKPLPPPPQQQQQQMQPQPIPGGILKYPTNTIPISLPIDMGPGPPPLPLSLPPGSALTAQMNQPPAPPHAQPPAPPLPQTSMAGSSSAATLLMTTPPPMPMGNVAGTTPSMATHTSRQASAASGQNKATTTTTTTTTTTVTATRKAARTKCCGCFGGHRQNDTNPSGSSSASSNKFKKKRQQKAQTMCSALLTNLGICALLLAYTLLGSFIFLTIESEDTSALLLQHQRTLASTKRGAKHANIHHNNHIYHANAAMDNATIAAMAAATSSTASGAATAGGATAHAEVLQGVLNNDFIYGGDDDAGVYGSGVGSQAELALSADTFDVRQRTIENIWDITVSLNILYKENWTKLAALEIAKFQDQLIKRLNEDALLQLSHDMDVHGNAVAADAAPSGSATHMQNGNSPATEAVLLHAYGHHGMHEWDFAKAFLYSLTVLTTIGYGNIAPRTTLGRLVTLVYALFGIPLTLVYLSSTGGILAKIAREVFSKALCCCLCSNCGYCCYDEKRMAEKERRTRRKRQQEELRKQQAALQEPYYVRSPSAHDTFHTPEKHAGGTPTAPLPPDIDSLSASESRGSMHGLSILAPILLCLSMMVIYIVFGAVVLYRLEQWPLLDGIYFCFMSLSTIGFGDMLPGLRRESTTTTWFCSIYIMSGMALTAMCFNVIHEEIVHRIRIVVEFQKGTDSNEEPAFYGTP